MPKTALLTGYSGFLGRHVLDRLVASGWQVILAGRTPSVGYPRAQFVPVDLDRPDTLAALGDRIAAEAVVHLASKVALSQVSDADLSAPNVLSTGALAALSKNWDAHMVFASSVAVHGLGLERIGADSPIAPDTPYGRSKVLGEDLVRSSGVDHCIVRLGGLFGRAGSAHLALNRTITAAIGGVPPVRVGRGTARRNYLYVKDAADSIVAAVERRMQGTHLLAGPEILSIGAMLDLVCNALNPGLRQTQKDGPEARDQIIERSSVFGPGVTFADAIRDIAREAKTCASD